MLLALRFSTKSEKVIKIISIPRFCILQNDSPETVRWIRWNGFWLQSLTGRIYEWKHGKATLASCEAPHFLPGLFIESYMARGKDHVYFYKPLMTWLKNSLPLSGKVTLLTWRCRYKSDRKEGDPLHPGQLSQPESASETNPRGDRHARQTPSFPRHGCSLRCHLDHD